MKEPFSLRITDSEDHERANKFKTVLHKRGANPTDVLRRLIEAYIAADGAVSFPARLVSLLGGNSRIKQNTTKTVASAISIRCFVATVCLSIRDFL